VGVKDGDEESCALQAKIEEGLLPLGFERENRPFHPHLTLARIKSLRGTAAMMKIVEIHKSRFVGECMIDRVILFRSELHPDGARYTKLIEAPFGSAES
jgi:2'-5' RNA ligase